MSDLDALIARARAPGELVGRREFSLSRERAIEKQREFTLRGPNQFALELVQAAVLAGASFIAIDTEDEAFTIAWVGAPTLRESTMEGLFDQLFADRADPAVRAMVQLAIGVNGLMQRRPVRLRIESGDLDGVARMDIHPGGRASVGRSQRDLIGTYVRAEWRKGLFARVSLRERTEGIQALIEERCGYCPVPLMLNHRAPFGYSRGKLPLGVWPTPRVLVQQRERSAILSIPSESAPRSGFHMVMGGVWVCTAALPELGHAFLERGESESVALAGVIYDDTLRKTADQADIVRDGRFLDMVRALSGEARALIEGSGASFLAPPPDPRLPSEAAKLPLTLTLLNRDRGLSLAELAALPPELPLLRVAPRDRQALAGELDSLSLMLPILLLEDEVHQSLEEALPGRSIRRLGSGGDVATVLAGLPRSRTLRREVGLDDGDTLELRLHPDGAPLSWGAGTPWALVQGGRTRWSGHVEPRYDGLSVVLHHLDPGPPGLRGLEAELSALLRQHAWRVLEDVDEETPVVEDFCRSLFEHHGLWHGAGEQAGRSLPSHWPRRLRDLALALSEEATTRGELPGVEVQGPSSVEAEQPPQADARRGEASGAQPPQRDDAGHGEPVGVARPPQGGRLHGTQDGADTDPGAEDPALGAPPTGELGDPAPGWSGREVPGLIDSLLDGQPEAAWLLRLSLRLDGVEIHAGLPLPACSDCALLVESPAKRRWLRFPGAPPMVVLLRGEATLSDIRTSHAIEAAIIAVYQRLADTPLSPEPLEDAVRYAQTYRAMRPTGQTAERLERLASRAPQSRALVRPTPEMEGPASARRPAPPPPLEQLGLLVLRALEGRAPIDQVRVTLEPWTIAWFSSGLPKAQLAGSGMRTLYLLIPTESKLAHRALQGDSMAILALAADSIWAAAQALRHQGHQMDPEAARLELLMARLATDD